MKNPFQSKFTFRQWQILRELVLLGENKLLSEAKIPYVNDRVTSEEIAEVRRIVEEEQIRISTLQN